ncbi:helix-turn-helix domain-containing protein [Acidovorax sp. 22279]|uniref:helix-turn-helix domain-containing protein n=1 Tax=Acidovorax sp. 22279 TaxID=3453900 RepID=UPI003F87543B
MIGTTPVAEGHTLTIEQAAEVLQCDTDTAAVRFNSGELPGVKFGRRWVIPAPAFFKRLNELALEEAERRRNQLAEERAAAAARAKSPQAISVREPAAARGRKRQPLPVLPQLPNAVSRGVPA